MNLNEDFKESYDFLIHNLNIGDFADLSLTEILTLYFLQKHTDPIVRHTLYVEIQNYLKSEVLVSKSEFLKKFSEMELRFFEFLKKKKNLSASSFYNSLSKLEEKGLINYIKDNKDKIVSIEPSKLTNPALSFLNQYFILMMIDDLNFKVGFGEKVKSIINQQHFESSLFISFRNFLELNLLKYFNQKSEKSYLLVKDSVLERLENTKIGSFEISAVNKKMIREPNNIFDLVSLLDYCKSPSFFGLSKETILKECERVIKPGGFLIVICRTKADLSDNLFANRLLEYYNFLFSRRGEIFTKSELLEDLQIINAKKIEIIEEQGLLIGIGFI